ncbi:zincin-like metallopeptidase domain-containing protein [Pseudomonas sp. S2.OTC.A_B10]|uniref:zincin-like metallopeptidase domain-containing protein n=1 Tax=Pseudomonas sp. S2.OTC.A_B10 TaxID=3237018 RepID=UPI003CEF9CA2
MTLSVDDATALVTQFCATYPVACRVKYKLRETQEEALDEPKATIERAGRILGAYFPASGVAAFATSNFRDEDHFKGTLRHEILGHFGINTFNPAEKRAVLDGIIEARNEPGMSDLWTVVDQLYPEADESRKAEEVFAFASEDIEPQTRGNVIEGARSYRETCIERSRPMQIRDLINVTTMVAEGMRDRSRSQQNFPESDSAQFKREQTMEPKKPFHEVVAERLIEQLKQGTAPWQMPWKAGDGGGMMPFNPTTGKRYKGINAIHLLSQGREDQRWLTFNQAKAVGAQVRKGEKSTSIQYWKFEEEQTKRDENNKPVLNGNGDPVKVRVRLERPKMFMANVFNAEQIDGLPAYQKPAQTWNALERAETILQASGADIRHGGDRAFYRPSTDNIQLPEKAQFPTADNYYATALHELGHWTGHGSRLDRDLANPFGSEGYAKEELRAEISSMILGDELGIGHDPSQHASYVQSWIKVLQNDPLEIFRAASDAEKIQTFVLGLEQQQIQTQDQTQQPPRLQDEPSEQGASMQIPSEPQPQRPSIEAENWALRAIERPDLDQVVLRMTDDQLQVFSQVLGTMHPLGNDNEFWTRREEAMEAMFNDVDTVADNIERAGEIIGDELHRRDDVAKRDQVQEAVKAEPEQAPLPALSGDEQMVATALRNVRNEPEPELKASFGRLLGVTSGQALGYELPGDWSGETQVTGIATDPDGQSVSMVQGDQVPEFYGLYARDQEGLAVWLADYATEAEAQAQADRLAAINSHAPVEAITNDQSVLAAKEESTEPEFTQEQSQAVQPEQPHAVDRTYVDVPFKEKEQARELGAKWDRQEKSWYIPDGVDKEPFAPWLNPAPKVEAAESTQERSEAPQIPAIPKSSREYLAVPFGEKAAAKAAGAAWDKAAKSWYVGPDGDAAALARWKPENVSNEQSPALDVRQEFIEAMEAVGLVPGGVKDHPIMDGKKHRVPVVGGRKGATDGFYVAHLDGHPAGVLINNKTGVDIKWKSKGYSLTDEQKAALHAEAASKTQAREAETLKTHEAVAAKVTRSMESLVPVAEPTPYLTAKGIQPLSGVLTDKAGKQTVIPAIDENGKQWTAQYIQQDGTKRFAKDGRKEGCFHPLGGMEALAAAPVIVIAEGYATSSTLAASLGHATVAAFDSGNLPAVAKALHAKFPDKPIVIAGDDDKHQVITHGTNAGRTKALEAAKAVGGKAIFPTFAPGEVLYPDTLPPITPQAFRKHVQATSELKAMVSESGPSAADPAQSERAAQLKGDLLSDAQLAALEKMKRLTDFNDLATKSSLGREGLERQVNNAVTKVIEQQQVKVQQPVQGIDDKQQPRRAIGR